MVDGQAVEVTAYRFDLEVGFWVWCWMNVWRIWIGASREKLFKGLLNNVTDALAGGFGVSV